MLSRRKRGSRKKDSWHGLPLNYLFRGLVGFATGIIGLPFGQLYVLIGANDASSPELSHGHGLNDVCFHEVFKSCDVHVLVGVLPKRKTGITGAPFVVHSCR